MNLDKSASFWKPVQVAFDFSFSILLGFMAVTVPRPSVIFFLLVLSSVLGLVAGGLQVYAFFLWRKVIKLRTKNAMAQLAVDRVNMMRMSEKLQGSLENLDLFKGKGRRIHQLKVWPMFFEEIRLGRKSWEFRKDDRGYKTGDILFLFSWDPRTEEYTGDCAAAEVTEIVKNGEHVAMKMRSWVGVSVTS